MIQPTLFIYHGLPGSGKTTLAKQKVNDTTVLVEMDEIRFNMFGIYHGLTREQKKAVYETRNTRISGYLSLGLNVVSSDTNLIKQQSDGLVKIAREHGAIIEHIYVDTPVKKCIQQNQSRDRVVPEHVITGFAKKCHITEDGYIPRIY